MTEASFTPGADEFGSIGYLVVEFPDGHVTRDRFDVLLDLVERGDLSRRRYPRRIGYEGPSTFL